MILFFLLFGICAAQYPAVEYGVPYSGRYQSPVKISQENYPKTQNPPLVALPNIPQNPSNFPKNGQYSNSLKRPISDSPFPSRGFQYKNPNLTPSLPGQNDQFTIPNTPQNNIPTNQFSKGQNPDSQYNIPSRPDQFSPNRQNPFFQNIPSTQEQFSPVPNSGPKERPNKEGSKLLDSTVEAERPSLQIPQNSRISIQDDRLQYSHGFSDDSGTKVSEQGSLLSTNGGWEYVIVKKGSYSYISPEGFPITVNYIADHNGYRII